MAEPGLLAQINERLIEQTVGEPDVVDLFDGVCQGWQESACRSGAPC